MKILFVTSYYPYPLNMGGKTVLYSLLRNLSKFHKITLLSFFDTEQDIISPTLESCCEQVVTVQEKRQYNKTFFIKAILHFSHKNREVAP